MPKVSAAHLESRRRQIIDAAVECFSREGFHRTTMQDIVREAGLSPGAIYSYFSSKDDIIEAIADERHAWEGELIAAARRDGDAGGALHRLARSFFAALSDPGEIKRRRIGVQIWAEALRNPPILKMVRSGVDKPRLILAELVRDAQKRSELPRNLDADAVARVMIALFQGFILQQAWDRRVGVETYVAVIEAALDGMLTRHERAHVHTQRAQRTSSKR